MTATTKTPLSTISKLVLLGLMTATIGIVVQIVSGAPYPKVPPVFFILLIPAAILYFGRRHWSFIITAIASLFLLQGLFSSGAYIRLLSTENLGDFTGIWIQTIGDVLAAAASLITIAQHYILHSAVDKSSI